MVSERVRFPFLTHNFFVWTIVCLLSVCAWISIFQQSLGMSSLPGAYIGTMGLTLAPFLALWLLMMIAMMLPALAPTIAANAHRLSQQYSPLKTLYLLLLFLLSYLLLWTLFGIPVFWLAQLAERLVYSTHTLSTILGCTLLVSIGLYQMTPLEKRFLSRCNPALCGNTHHSAGPTSLVQFREGLTHGLHCLGCCGALMLVMVAVGLMNLPWMLLLTLVILIEKTWRSGARFSFFVGFALLIFAVLAFAEPALLAGLYRPF